MPQTSLLRVVMFSQSIKIKKFRLYHDNRRLIIEPKILPTDNNDFSTRSTRDLSATLLDSTPLVNRKQALRVRFVCRFHLHCHSISKPLTLKTTVYKNFLEMGVRSFIKAYVAKRPCLGLLGTEFKTYNDLIVFISEFYSSNAMFVKGLVKVRLTKQSI